jgi:hypothetical protein
LLSYLHYVADASEKFDSVATLTTYGEAFGVDANKVQQLVASYQPHAIQTSALAAIHRFDHMDLDLRHRLPSYHQTESYLKMQALLMMKIALKAVALNPLQAALETDNFLAGRQVYTLEQIKEKEKVKSKRVRESGGDGKITQSYARDLCRTFCSTGTWMSRTERSALSMSVSNAPRIISKAQRRAHCNL